MALLYVYAGMNETQVASSRASIQMIVMNGVYTENRSGTGVDVTLIDMHAEQT